MFDRQARLRTRRNVIAMGSLLGGAILSGVGSARAQGPTPGDRSCFLRGTRVRTPSGPVNIEDLGIGDLVVTRSGETRPTQWVARRRYRRAPGTRWVENVQPVRIARHALAANKPSSDLFISDDHALFFDGVLIPVINLLNGTTIARYPADEFAEIEYFHLKLSAHDFIYAEGVACETLGGGDFEQFDNFIEYERLYGRSEEPAGALYAPLVRFDGGRSQLKSRFRSALSPWIDRRAQIDRIRDELEDRAEALVAEVET
jgi:Hint domain